MKDIMKIVYRTPQEVLKLWVKALRSGKYKQSVGRLRFDDGFCCLGVLCDLAAKDGGRQWDDGLIVTNLYTYCHQPYTLPLSFKKYLNFDRRLLEKFIEMNDTKRYSFSKIADYIEETLINKK